MSSLNSNIKLAINHCLAQGIRFACFRRKGGAVQFFCDPDGDASTDATFIITPWLARFADSDVIGNCVSLSEVLRLTGPGMKPVIISESTDHENYTRALQSLVPTLKVDNRKTVISAIVTNCATVNWAEVADILFDTYPECFCHIYYTPRLGAWIGATPELLLSADHSMSMVTTMALAGTKTHNNSWDDKNRHEQAIVTDFIVDKLRPLFSEINVSPIETIHYGNIDHLCTHIAASGTSCRYSEIVDLLSPTPAVAGLPRDMALKEINDIESHDRECYGGYITVADSHGSQSFVNLRCAHFSEDEYVVYAGGGITGESDPQTEWLETRLKSAALINIINSATNN